MNQSMASIISYSFSIALLTFGRVKFAVEGMVHITAWMWSGNSASRSSLSTTCESQGWHVVVTTFGSAGTGYLKVDSLGFVREVATQLRRPVT